MQWNSPPRRLALNLHEGAEEVKIRTWVQLVHTYLLLQRQVTSAITQHGLTLAQFDVLATLRFSEGVTQQELAERLLVTKGNVCGVLDRMEQAGWVKRRPDEKDARVNRLHLTAAGKAKIDKVFPAHDAAVLRALSPLSAEEAASLREKLQKLERE